MSYGVDHRHSWDPELLWVWRRQAAVAPIRPLTPSLGTSICLRWALKSKKKKKDQRRRGYDGNRGQSDVIADRGNKPEM